MLQNFTQKTEKYSGSIRYKDFYDDYYARINRLGIKSVTELGMGSGDFLYHLPSDVQGIGIDVSEDLVEVARQTRKKNNLEFECKDILVEKNFQMTDLVVMTGFMCTFLDFRAAIDKSMEISRKYIFINDFLNIHGVDCKYSFREKGDREFQTVYNIWSISTIKNYLESLRVNYEIVPYEMTTRLIKSENPMHNYHADINGQSVIVNDGGVILHGYNIYIEKNKF